MSLYLMNKAMDMKVGNPLRKLILLNLADNAHDDGECLLSPEYIADRCEISESALLEHLNDLKSMGVLEKTDEKILGESVYVLMLDSYIGGSLLEVKS